MLLKDLRPYTSHANEQRLVLLRAFDAIDRELNSKVKPMQDWLQRQRQADAAASLAIEKYLTETGLDCTAIICGNDLLALGAIRSLRSHGYETPDDVSVVGYDDIDFASSATVPLTSIAQPKYQLGFAAAELVIDECRNPASHVHQRIAFQPQLIVRGSTRSILNDKVREKKHA